MRTRIPPPPPPSLPRSLRGGKASDPTQLDRIEERQKRIEQLLHGLIEELADEAGDNEQIDGISLDGEQCGGPRDQNQGLG